MKTAKPPESVRDMVLESLDRHQVQDFIPVRELPAVLQELGFRRRHVSSVYRWLLKGVQGRKLRTVRLGGSFVSKQDLATFIASLSEDDE